MYGQEKAWAERDWKRRAAYRMLGELHIPGRLRSWHVIGEMRRLGLWDRRPRVVYDAGGGEGAFAYWLARRFPTWRVVIADNEPGTLERGLAMKAALGLDNLDVRRIDLRDPGEHDAYDVVLCTDVLEHIEEDDTVMKHLAYALRPGGVVIVTSPSVPQPRHLPIVAWRERRIGFTPADYGHVRDGYSEPMLARLFQNAGLEVDHMRRTFGPFGTLMFDVFFATGDSEPHPLVYASLFPVYMGLAGLDVLFPGARGAAILGVARKPRDVQPARAASPAETSGLVPATV